MTFIKQFHALVDAVDTAASATADFVAVSIAEGNGDAAQAECVAWMKSEEGVAAMKAMSTRYQYTAGAKRLFEAAKEGKLPERPNGAGVLAWDRARRGDKPAGAGGGKKAMTPEAFVAAFMALDDDSKKRVGLALKAACPAAFKA